VGPLFSPKTPEATRVTQTEAVKRRLSYVNETLAKRPFLTGERFTVADAYLFTILGWLGRLGIDIAEWPTLKSYYERVGARPAVQTVLKAEAPPS
jgi:glutathione S-transferase